MLMQHFQMLACYNKLANYKLYETCAQLPDSERKCRRPAFFRSIHGTLNHILVGDRIWMTRFVGGEIASTGLDMIIYQDFEELWTARTAEDDRIEAFVANLPDGFLMRTIEYVNSKGKIYSDPAPLLFAHFFNHQTHHRGQIHDMITQTEINPPMLDMHRVIHP